MTKYSWGDVTFEGWLASLHSRPATRTGRAVLNVLMQQPERASHASTTAIADAAGVNVASVTRAAQALGFPGWPALREELRSRYLTSLGRAERDEAEGDVRPSRPLDQSLEADLRVAARTRQSVDHSAVEAAVHAFAAAPIRLAIGTGTYGLAAQLLASLATLAGYETSAPTEGSALVSSIARIDPAAFVVAVGFWRHHDSTLVAVEGARSRGATICAITDAQPSPLTDAADHVILVSAEGSTFFPSLTSAVALINGFCAELAALDPKRTSHSVRLAEVEWTRSGYLRRPVA